MPPSRLFAKWLLAHGLLLAVLMGLMLLVGGDWRLWAAIGVYGIAALAVGAYLARGVAGPVRALSEQIERLERGEPTEPVYVATHDELGLLAGRFNRMSRGVVARLERLNESRDRMATVLGNMIEGVIAVDDRERVLFANDAAARLLGFDAERAVGRPLMEAVRNHTLHEAVSIAFAARSNSLAPRTLEFEPIGRAQVLSISTTRLPGQPCPGVVLVMHDVTELRRLESLRQEFVANVSHELKTPLSAIKAYAETLLGGALEDAANNRPFVERIEEQADRLHQLILHLLSLARIESGQEVFEIERVPLVPIIEQVCRDAEPAVQEKRLELYIEPSDDPLTLRADQEGLREILANLVDNAIKYTPEGGRIIIRHHGEKQQVVIEVEDTGIGIPADRQARIFERFYRVDRARSRELGGTGLGLSIVKHLCLAFGGSVSVSSRLGEGSTFSVRLPVG